MNIYLMKKPKRINSVSVTLFLMAAVTAYLGWAYIPIYWPLIQMSGIMRGVCNDAYREQRNDALLQQLVREGKRTRLRISADNFSVERVAYSEEEMMNQSEHAKSILRARGKACVISFHYEDTYTWPLFDSPHRVVFDRTVETPLETVKWTKDETAFCTCVSVPDRN